MLRGDAERPETGRGPLALGDGLAIVVLGLAQLLLRDRLRLEELARQGHRLVRTLDVRDRLRVVRLRAAEVGAVEHQEALAGFDGVARAGKHLDDAPGGRRLDAHQLLLVELRLAARLDGRDAHLVRGPHRLDDWRGFGRDLGRPLLLGAGVAAPGEEPGREEEDSRVTQAYRQFPGKPPTAVSS